MPTRLITASTSPPAENAMKQPRAFLPSHLLLGWLLLVSSACLAEVPLQLHVTTGFTPPVSDYFGDVLRELDQRMPDVEFSFEEMSAERSLDLVNRAINDAECCRFPKVIVDKYPNLLPIGQSFHTVRFVAFSKRDDLQLRTFDDLKPYSVGTVQGWRLAVKGIERVSPREQFILNDPTQLMEMLAKDRIEIAVVGLLSGLEAMREIGLQGVHAYQDPPLAAVPLVMMLNQRHRALVGPIDQALLQMQRDGTIPDLQQKMLDSYR